MSVKQNFSSNFFIFQIVKMDDIELTIRLIMNHKQACQAIGRSGSNIKSLRDETGCKITMTNKDHPKRIMTISSKKSAAMKGTQYW